MFISKSLSSVISLKKTLSFGVFFLLLASASFVMANSNAHEAPDSLGNIPALADPCLLEYDGTYYLYGTSDKAQEGFKVYMSTDLISWSGAVGARNGYALHKSDAWGDKSFWAPQVFRHKNKFYMAYAANESIAIAESNSPLGPFTQKVKQSLSSPVKQIDPFVFIDDDGRKYLYHVRVANGGNRIFVAELTKNLKSIKPETLRECVSATEEWENAEHAKWSVAEGPSILKHKGLYYLIYSTNHFRSINYAVGYAVSKSPYGPWEKYSGNPVLSRSDVKQNGTGHGDFVKDSLGNLVYVFHTHFSDTSVAPRRTAVVKAGFSNDPSTGMDKLEIHEKSFYYLNLKE
ncbi:glycoside hydrolase family 43 protein [Daejeonella sp.]|uniref:glycoside hydrolase family 43 protein n=1 Tax=Daejeonella sp. TaxID=2805397 RepID=UPI0030C47677